MMKRYIGLFVVALLALSVVSTVGVVSAKGSIKTAPTLQSPTLGTHFTAGQSITLSWTPVSKATGYNLYFRRYDPSGTYEWTAYSPTTSFNYGDATGDGFQVAWWVYGVVENNQMKITQTGPWGGSSYFYT